MDQRSRVVVGVDGSAGARTALEFALQEAARRDAVLDVVSVAVTPEWAAPHFSDSYYSCYQAACR